MNNRESLAHALQGEAKREYNKRYYEEHVNYWPEWREKNKNSGGGGGSGWNDQHYGSGGGSSFGSKSSKTEGSAKSYYNPRTERAARSKWYTEYYGPKPVTAGGGKAQSAISERVTEALERVKLTQEKRIRIRDRIASVYKLEWAEAQERAKRLPNRIINSVKNTISNVASSFVEAIRLGKK